MTADAGRAGARHDRQPYRAALAQCGVLDVLAPFDPHVAGTPPLGLDLPGSDIDILCFALNMHAFADVVWRAFSNAPGFRAKQWVEAPWSMVASFQAAGWQIEVYGEAIPVEQQRGWRHFVVERRLLVLGGDCFRTALRALRQSGMKTEPAFASALGLNGDPYLTLLDLGEQNDEALISALQGKGFAGASAQDGHATTVEPSGGSADILLQSSPHNWASCRSRN